VHTVGGYASGSAVTDGDIDQFEQMMNLNALPVLLVGGEVAQHMQASGGGKIVIVLARAAFKGTAKHSAYTASKAAAQRIMESLSLEVREHGVNVNGIAPSTVDTPANRAAMPDADTRKWVTPDQLAGAIAFLASDAASAIHGATLEVYNRA
jgi:NAD(P)-dependent dehydrogenase (short-subunit alcohol dehydrogenase family)